MYVGGGGAQGPRHILYASSSIDKTHEMKPRRLAELARWRGGAVVRCIKLHRKTQENENTKKK